MTPPRLGDAIGHVAKNSNRKLASKLMETFAQLASSHKCVGGRARREAPAAEAVRCAPGARQPLALEGGGWEDDKTNALIADRLFTKKACLTSECFNSYSF